MAIHSIAVPFGVGLLVGIAAAPALARACRASGWLDRPGGHKAHAGPVPLGGVLFTLPLLFQLSAVSPRLLWSGLAVLGVGLLEDVLKSRGRGIPWTLRLLALAAAVMVLWGDPAVFGRGTSAGSACLLLLLASAVAFNWFDHADGMCAGAALGALSAMALRAADPDVMSGVSLGLLIAFLRANAFQGSGPRLFLGDAGAQFLGFAVAALALGATEERAPSLWTAVAASALPLADALRVAVVRLAAGGAPWRPDRGHVGHLAARWGLGRRLPPLICAAAAFITVIVVA